MLIVSWNVAGLKPALQRIHSDYGRPSSNGGGVVGAGGGDGAGSKSKPPSSASSSSAAAGCHPLATYLRLHGGVDVLCLQEHKIPLSQLKDRSEPHRCASVPGYESFWSCATGAGSRGFNGVVTYCRSGLVRSADRAPLKDEGLDGQGRCVMTDHGSFVLFNVYVPNGGHEFRNGPNKMRFLTALRAAMERQREGGRRVVLVGDLNLKIDRRDIYWRFLSVNVDDVLRQCRRKNGGDDGAGDGLPKWKKDVAAHWGEIERVLETIEAVPQQTTNPTTKKTFDRYRARVRLGEHRSAMLGTHEDAPEDALECYSFRERTFVDPTTDSEVVRRRKNLVTVETLAELMRKIAKVSWDEATLREIAASRDAGLNPDAPEHLWMRSLLEGDDGMVDAFRHFYPTAEARFTCWNQMENKRYVNVGGRIDYTVVDKALLDDVEKPKEGTSLRCGKEPHTNPLGEEAALLAATAGGLFEGGSYAGGGIAAATRRALDTQFGEPHTGVVYTPPSYSDHVAVSLRMRDGFRDSAGTLILGGDAATRGAQPHKAQRSISAFFGTRAGPAARSSAPNGDKKRTILRDIQGSEKGAKAGRSSSKRRTSVPKNSVLKHFGAK